MVVPRDISEQRLDYVHWDMDGNQMFRYPMDIQEMGCATWDDEHRVVDLGLQP
ncbi:hypothetical protein DAPPUDRAFT_256613 [Daphnia pulex]|uniref:Uncharacterized protein n=1 Tax=Daphnia pulex TaxID=6669 RepID=E9HBS0_DAPPU|nr:hypothetical protein DAPPUDRAFT_256613 [Daphnia pulex]|eukprot:EFX70823.1 hypothetical protein DAPPUDRAFT_256613 [Daphnia pulex]